MLKNFALIASVISGITAITTSLRALGKSRENLRNEAVSRVNTGCRIGECKTAKPSAGQGSLLIHVIVTVIWFTLAVACALPILHQQWEGVISIQLFLGILPFILLLIILCLIWWKIIQHGK
ncbi:MAG: hypothetical protein ABFR82_06815 [Nitrospirota bacterium]